MADHTTQISRVTRSKQAAKSSYDRLSRWYDVLVGWGEERFRQVGLQKLAARPGERVLEIGFGTGHGILALAQAVGDAGRVYGLDISEGMRHITQARIEKAGLTHRVDLRLGDASQLLFAANDLHAVFASFTLELFDTPEIPTVLREARRVLRRGGRIGLVAMSREGKLTLAMRLYEWSHTRFPNYVDCRPIYVQRALAETGFQIIDTTRMSYWGIPVEIVVAAKP